MTTPFTIAPDGSSITCHRCRKTSYNPSDIHFRYCGYCHQFFESANGLPSVAGRMEMTHEDFQRACRVVIDEVQCGQSGQPWHAAVITLLCEAVRCSRECCELAKGK